LSDHGRPRAAQGNFCSDHGQGLPAGGRMYRTATGLEFGGPPTAERPSARDLIYRRGHAGSRAAGDRHSTGTRVHGLARQRGPQTAESTRQKPPAYRQSNGNLIKLYLFFNSLLFSIRLAHLLHLCSVHRCEPGRVPTLASQHGGSPSEMRPPAPWLAAGSET
jgi:hypothetical protein